MWYWFKNVLSGAFRMCCLLPPCVLFTSDQICRAVYLYKTNNLWLSWFGVVYFSCLCLFPADVVSSGLLLFRCFVGFLVNPFDTKSHVYILHTSFVPPLSFRRRFAFCWSSSASAPQADWKIPAGSSGPSAELDLPASVVVQVGSDRPTTSGVLKVAKSVFISVSRCLTDCMCRCVPGGLAECDNFSFAMEKMEQKLLKR